MKNNDFKFALWLIHIVCSIVFLSGCWFSDSSKIATFEGGSIDQKDMKENAKNDLYKLRKNEYQTKTRIAYRLATEKIIALESEKQKKNENTLVDEYVQEKLQPPSEQDILNYYKRNKERINRPYQEVKEDLHQQQLQRMKENLKSRFYSDLLAKYKFELKLKAPEAPAVEINVKDEPFWGDSDAKVVVVEYSDFECPYCQRIQTDIRRIRKEYEDKIKWVFKDFPLSFHKQAEKAHIAANCALDQGNFFDFQYQVFDSSSDISPPKLIEIAQGIGYNMDDFKKCMADSNGSKKKEIEEDIRSGVAAGVGGTPTIFLNGKIQTNFRSYANMKKNLDDALNLTN